MRETRPGDGDAQLIVNWPGYRHLGQVPCGRFPGATCPGSPLVVHLGSEVVFLEETCLEESVSAEPERLLHLKFALGLKVGRGGRQ